MALLLGLLAFFIGFHLSWADVEKISCQDGFVSSGNRCFKILSESNATTWLEAQYECEQLNGRLAEPDDIRTIDFLRELSLLQFELTGIGNWYIGLTDLFSEGFWHFPSTGQQPNITLWQKGSPSPDHINNLDCAAMKLENTEVFWQDIECDSELPNSGPVLPICQRLRCPEGTQGFGDYCYLFENSTELSWPEAENICTSIGGHLASVHSAKEHSFICDLVKGTSANCIWLGGIVTGSDETSFYWSDGSPVDFTNWNDPEPQNDDNMCLRTIDLEWGDTARAAELYYICKINII